LDKYKDGAKDALTRGEVQRKTPADLDRDSLIDAAAECIKQAAKEAFADMGIDETTMKPRNPWPATDDQKKAAAAAAASVGAPQGLAVI
jgi:hypothetical protein